MPGGLAAGNEVVQPAELGIGQGGAGGMGGDVGEQLGAGGRAMLVVDDGERVPLGGQAEHGLGEVAAAGGIHPAGTEDEVAAAALADEVFAFELGTAVDGQGAGGRVFRARGVAAAVKDVVGGVMDEQRAAPGGFAGEDARREGVEGAGEVGFAFGFVDSGVGGGVDDQVGGDGVHGGGEAVGVGEVAGQARGAVVVEGDDVTHGGEAALQLPADLAVLAEEEDLHRGVLQRAV